MGSYVLGALTTVPTADRPELLAPPVARGIAEAGLDRLVGVVEIDPRHADTASVEREFGLEASALINCLIVTGRRGGVTRIGACVVPSHARADMKGRVKPLLDVRTASFLAYDSAVASTQMESGGITPIGLPREWPILVDAAALDIPLVVLGSGVRRSKLIMPGAVLAELPGVQVCEQLTERRTAFAEQER